MMWRLLYIRPSAQARVTRAIAELAQAGREGLETYYPRERIWSGIGSRRKPCDRPLLPSMIFVHAGDEHLDALMKVDGVYRRLDPHTAGNAMAIAKFIQDLKFAEDQGGFDRTYRKKVRVEIGQRVRIATGPFFGFYATVVGLSRSGKVKLVAEVFGREQRTEAQPNQIEGVTETLDTGVLAAA